MDPEELQDAYDSEFDAIIDFNGLWNHTVIIIRHEEDNE